MQLKESVFLIFAVVLSHFLISCSDRPSQVLGEKEMVNLLVDMEIAEAYSNTQNTRSTQKEDLGKQVLEAHGVTPEELDTTLAWYGRNMDDYTALFEKVDKELNSRRIKYTEIPGEKQKESDELWPYSPHVVVSPLSGYESVNFSIPNPGIEKGERLLFSFYLTNPVSIKGTLGVEYINGNGEASLTNSNNKSSVKLELQTDSTQMVSRIFGTMFIKDSKNLPLYIDSISLKAAPIDTLEYRSKRRVQKVFGPQP